MIHKVAKRILSAVLIVFGILLLSLIIFLANLENIISDKASDATGRKVEVTNDIRVNWGWPVTKLQTTNLKISNFEQGSDPVMMSIDDLRMSINFFSLLKGHLEFPEIVMEKPHLLLEKDKDGNANWNILDNAGGGTALEMAKPDDRSDFPVIGSFVIHDGNLVYKDPVKETSVDMSVESFSGGAGKKDQVHFDGKGTYQKREFAINLLGGNIFQLKDTNDPYPVDLKVTIGGTKIALLGTILDPMEMKGLDTQLSLSGKDASELFTIFGIALPPTPPYEVKGDLHYVQNVWKFDNFKGRMGSSDLSGSVAWDTTRERPLLSGEFISNKLNFADLGGFIGAGPATDKTDKNSPYVIPDTPLDISRLAAMDAQVTFTGKKLISDALPLDDFMMKVNLEDRLLKLEPVRFGTAKGDIKILMSINARQEPVKIDGDFNFRRLELKQIFEKLAQTLGVRNYASGYIGGTAKLSGTGKSLREMLKNANGNAGLGMEGGQISNLVVELLGLDVFQSLGMFMKGDQPVPVRCIIGDFKVDNGLMQVRHFVLDTTDSNIMGTGTINLKNEALNLTLYTNPKDNSLISLNSPIRLTGTMKDPKVNVNLGNIAGRGAAAAAIGTIIFPVVAIAAFIEPGLGKDSPCAALIREMNQHTGRTGKENMVPKNPVSKPAK